MKILDKQELVIGIKHLQQSSQDHIKHIDALKRSITKIIEMDSEFTGEGGTAIREFYDRTHYRFLVSLKKWNEDFINQLDALLLRLDAVDSDQNAYIHQQFLEHELVAKVETPRQITRSIKEEINGLLTSIQDIVAVPFITDERFDQKVQEAMDISKETVERLEEFDYIGTKSLNKLEPYLDSMQTYLDNMYEFFQDSNSKINADAGSRFRWNVWDYEEEEDISSEDVEDVENPHNSFVQFLLGVYDGSGEAVGDMLEPLQDTYIYDLLFNQQNLPKRFEETKEFIENAWEDPYTTLIQPVVDMPKYISQAVSEAWERDVVNGDVQSATSFFTYGFITIGVATYTRGSSRTVNETHDYLKLSKKAILLKNMEGASPAMAGATAIPYKVLNEPHEKMQNDINATNRKENPTSRLPRTNGKWEGQPGNGKWYSSNKEVKEITDGKPVEFKDGRPDFSPWSELDITFNKGELKGTRSDFDLVYIKIKELVGLENKTQAKNWLSEQGLTPHHFDDQTIQLVPTKLHGNIPHIGSASDLRGGY